MCVLFTKKSKWKQYFGNSSLLTGLGILSPLQNLYDAHGPFIYRDSCEQATCAFQDGSTLVHKTTYEPMIYTAPCVTLLIRAPFITWASGRGLCPGNLEFFVPQMALVPPTPSHLLHIISKT
jgi:hypothetical protein